MGAKEKENVTEIVYSIMIEKKVKGDDIDNILVSALEGGINYWCRTMKVVNEDYKGADYGSHVVSRGGAIKLKDDDSGKWYMLDKDKFLKGLKLMYDKHPAFDIDNSDAGDADCIVQYAIFGDIIYG